MEKIHMKVDEDIQREVADEFCKRLDKGESLVSLVHWAVEEMNRRQIDRIQFRIRLEAFATVSSILVIFLSV